MRTGSEIYDVMDMLKPYLQRIAKDLEEMGLGLAINSSGGEAVLYEQEKNVIYEHHMKLDEEMTAFEHEVRHRFDTQEIEEYHEEIDRRFDQMMGVKEWGNLAGGIA